MERRQRQRGKKSQVCATGSMSPECEKTEGARKHEGRECRVLYLDKYNVRWCYGIMPLFLACEENAKRV